MDLVDEDPGPPPERAVTEQKIDELTRRVEKHNRLVERTYLLERDAALLKNDVDGLERKADRDG